MSSPLRPGPGSCLRVALAPGHLVPHPCPVFLGPPVQPCPEEGAVHGVQVRSLSRVLQQEGRAQGTHFAGLDQGRVGVPQPQAFGSFQATGKAAAVCLCGLNLGP